MKNNALAIVALAAIAALVACGGGTPPTSAPTIQSALPTGAPQSANVSFVVVVPGAVQPGSLKRRPAFVAPQGTQSISITLTSVNGVAYNGTPTVEAISGSNAACVVSNGEDLCSFNLTVPVGTLLFTIDTFASANGTGTPTGEGVVQVTTTAGGSATVTTSLGGTPTKLVVLLDGGAELGVSGSVPVLVNGLDANGNTILGNYTAPISVTFSDTDASGQTSLSTTAVQRYTGSSASSTVSLNYQGGAMSSAAMVGATAPGFAAANITSASFLPDQTAPSVNGATTTFEFITSSSEGSDSTPAPSPWPTSTGTYTLTVATGQSFGGQSNLVAISGLGSPVITSPTVLTTCCYLDDPIAYFTYTPKAGAASLGFVGFIDVNGNSEMCSAPFGSQLVLPFPASWNVLEGAGSCSVNLVGGEELGTINSDGSYSDTVPSGGFGAGPYTVASHSDGSVLQAIADSTSGPSYIMTIPVPSPGASAAPMTLQSFTGTIPPSGTPGTPAPVTTTGPNPWLVAGVASGQPPSPLVSDSFVNKGSISSLPASCAVPGTITGNAPTLSEADESVVIADPMEYWSAFYTTMTLKHYYLAGVGEVCNENLTYQWTMSISGPAPFPQITTEGGLIPWYQGTNNAYDTFASDTFSFVTATTLTATYAHRRDFAQALPATAQAFAAASYVMARSHERKANSNLRWR